MYAFGGLVKQATNALIGEAGAELLVPMRGGPVTNAPGTETVIQDYLKKINPSRGKDQDHIVVVPLNINGRALGSALVRIAHRSV
jgi:actin-like ATPase involved in cell morphogenesis